MVNETISKNPITTRTRQSFMGISPSTNTNLRLICGAQMLGKSPESGSGQPRTGGRTQNVPRIMFASRGLVKLQEIARYSRKGSSSCRSAAAQEPEPGSSFETTQPLLTGGHGPSSCTLLVNPPPTNLH